MSFLGFPEILILGLLALLAFPSLARRHGGHRSPLVVATITLLIAGAAVAVFTVQEGDRRHAFRKSEVAVRRAENALRKAKDKHARVLAAVARDRQQSISAEPGVSNEIASESRVHIEETDHGQLLVMPLSAETLRHYVGDEGAEVLDQIRQLMPTELNQAYFMVPLPGTMGEAMPGISTLARTIANVAQTTTAASAASVPTPKLHSVSSSVPGLPRPDWLEHPPQHHTIVTTEFEESPELTERHLRDLVSDSLLDSAWQTVLPGGGERIDDGRQFRLTETAVESCIQARYQETADLGIADAPTTMYSTTALVSFPQEIHQKAVLHATRSLQNQRTWTIAMATVSVCLVMMLAAGLFRGSRHTGRVTSTLGTLLAIGLIIPGIAVSGHLVTRIASNRSIDIPSPHQLPDTLIDVAAAEPKKSSS